MTTHPVQNLEIVERSSGFWVTNGLETIEGPFDSPELAQLWISETYSD